MQSLFRERGFTLYLLLPSTRHHTPHVLKETCTCHRHRSMHYKHTHSWSSFGSPFTYTLNELLRLIYNTVFISDTSLPKTLNDLERHLVSSWEKHRNCSKGTKQVHRHTSCPGKLFERGLGCWLLWLFTFNLTFFHQSTSRNTKGALKWRFLFIIFVPWMWAAGKKTATQHIQIILFNLFHSVHF